MITCDIYNGRGENSSVPEDANQVSSQLTRVYLKFVDDLWSDTEIGDGGILSNIIADPNEDIDSRHELVRNLPQMASGV